MVLILISSLFLSLQNPLNDPEGDLVVLSNRVDYVFTTIFTFEVILKIIAYGFAFCGPKSYIRNEWNVLDFSIVIICLLSLLLPESSISFMKVLRLGRLLRPLKLISNNEGLRTSMKALVISVPKVLE